MITSLNHWRSTMRYRSTTKLLMSWKITALTLLAISKRRWAYFLASKTKSKASVTTLQSMMSAWLSYNKHQILSIVMMMKSPCWMRFLRTNRFLWRTSSISRIISTVNKAKVKVTMDSSNHKYPILDTLNRCIRTFSRRSVRQFIITIHVTVLIWVTCNVPAR
jgi:hypothetical protein